MTPEGWKHAVLSEIADVNPDQLQSSTSAGYEIRYIDISSIARTGTVSPPKALPFGDAPSRARRRVRADDIIVSTVRPHLRSFARMREATPNLVASTGFAVVRPSDRLDSEFIYQNILSEEFVGYLQPRTRGGNYPAVGAEDVASFPLLLPPPNERQKIAAILSSVDDAIESAQAVIDQLGVVKKAMMAELLTRGLPGRHTKFKQTEIGEVPEEWDVVRLGELASQITDGEHQTPRRTLSGVLLLSARNVVDGELRLVDVDYVDEEEYERIAKRCRPQADDILISCSGSIGRVCRVPEGLRFGLVRSVALVRPRPSVVRPRFLEHTLRSRVLQKQMDDSKKQAAQANLFQGAIRGLFVPVPPLVEQDVIADVLSSIDARLDIESFQLEETKKLKSALLSVLLTGEVRVTPDEAAP